MCRVLRGDPVKGYSTTQWSRPTVLHARTFWASGAILPSVLPGHTPPTTHLASFPMGQIEREAHLVLTEDKNQA